MTKTIHGRDSGSRYLHGTNETPSAAPRSAKSAAASMQRPVINASHVSAAGDERGARAARTLRAAGTSETNHTKLVDSLDELTDWYSKQRLALSEAMYVHIGNMPVGADCAHANAMVTNHRREVVKGLNVAQYVVPFLRSLKSIDAPTFRDAVIDCVQALEALRAARPSLRDNGGWTYHADYRLDAAEHRVSNACLLLYLLAKAQKNEVAYVY